MDILMPQLGETVAEGKITKWFKAVGDAVKPGENLFEIETDKVSMEVPATSAGIIAEIRVAAGEVVPVGAVVAVISDKAGAGTNPPAASTAPPKVAATPARATPLDPFNEVRTPAPRPRPAFAAATAPVGAASADQVRALYAGTPHEEVPLDAMRRAIAARLLQSKQTIPHFYLTMDVDIGRLLAAREEANAAAPKTKDGNPSFKISVNDFVIKALAIALQRMPEANAVWAEDRILRFRHSDVGVAVALEGGLLTPVIRKAETKSLTAISAEMKDLAARARERRLKPQEYQGGSTAISNLGMYGVREFSAIINPPHATILAVGAGQRRPVETEDGGVKFVTQMTVTLSCDHRVVDGALGAQLLDAFKALIERPLTMLV